MAIIAGRIIMGIFKGFKPLKRAKQFAMNQVFGTSGLLGKDRLKEGSTYAGLALTIATVMGYNSPELRAVLEQNLPQVISGVTALVGTLLVMWKQKPNGGAV